MGNTGPKPSVKKALADGTATGFMKQSSGNGPGGKRLYQSWRWTGSDWEKVSKYAYQQWLVTQEYDGMKLKDLTIGPIGENVKPTNQTHRWPEDAINTGTDYVFFQFGKYIPPFSEEAQALRRGSEEALGKEFKYGSASLKNQLVRGSTRSATKKMYDASITQLKVQNSDTIMLPMPQDLSTEGQQQWQGKQFTATGRAATAALAAGNFSYASEVVANIAGNATALQTAFNTSVLNSIPGVGGNIDFNDVSGSTRGIVINPNAELLYDSPEMREIGMIFKLVPRNYNESIQIRNIIKTFRKASMPSWGSEDTDLLSGESKVNQQNEGKGSQINLGGKDNWIHVPKLCKFTFMTGSKANRHIIQYKPCAISAVEVNYTPDGTWTSYNNPGHPADIDVAGSPPVAVELRLNFMETKLIFADEVEMGF